MVRWDVSRTEAVRSPWRNGRVLGNGAKTRQEDKYGQRKKHETAATGTASVYTRPVRRSGERPTHLDKPLCSGCPERVTWQLGLKSTGSQQMYGPNCCLIAELLLCFFFFPFNAVWWFVRGVYSWHIVGSFHSTGTSGPFSLTLRHQLISQHFFFPFFLSPIFLLSKSNAPRKMASCVVSLTPLMWPGCCFHLVYSAQELMMISLFWSPFTDVVKLYRQWTIFYDRSAVWQKQLSRIVYAILPE